MQLTLQDGVPAEQLRSIVEGRIDGGFVGLAPPERVPGIRFVPWRREALALFLPRGHRLAGRTAVAVKALAGEPMVAIAADAAPALASKIQALCQRAGFRPRIVQEAARAQAVVAMVAAGSGLAILPASVRRVTGRAISAATLASPEAIVTYVFAYRAGPVSSELGRFVEALRSELEDRR